jgi:ElaB/YqjD/DUF883 family membrane-anchored ribosome-binding protein
MDTNTSVADTADAVADRTRNTVDRAAQTAHEAIDRLAAKAGPAIDRLRGTANTASETLRAKADQFGELEEQWVESARTYVRENPLAAVGIAVAVGLLIGKLTSSSSSR